MKMGLNDFSANEAINQLDSFELEKIFKFFGDEKEAKKIAIKIVEERKKKKILKFILQLRFSKLLEFLLIKK